MKLDVASLCAPVALALIPLVPGCAGASPGAESLDDGPVTSPVLLDEAYAMGVAYRSDVRVNGVAAGDLDPSTPGDELVAVDHEGRVHLVRRTADGFSTEMIAATGGELVQVAVGDLMPWIDGDEIVAVGAAKGTEIDQGPGAIRVFYRDQNAGWVGLTHTTPRLVHGVAIGVLAGDDEASFVCAGSWDEALVGTVGPTVDSLLRAAGLDRDEVGDGIAFDPEVFQMLRADPRVELRVKTESIALEDIGNIKAVAMAGASILFAADDGTVASYGKLSQLAFAPPGFAVAREFERRHVANYASALARADYDGSVGTLLCDNDGQLRLVFGTGEERSVVILDRSRQRLRGAIFADIDPDHPGPEACSAGYDGRIRVIRLNRVEEKQLDLPGQPVSIGWTGDLSYVAQDSAKLHHLCSAEIDGFGTCLVSCGYSGDLLVIRRR